MRTDEQRTYQREYARTEKRKATIRKYNQSENGKARNNANNARWRAENREKLLKSYKKHDLKRHYGLTPEQHEAMWIAQEKKCAVCGSTDSGRKTGHWCIDHCHKTGAVRGIVCNSCNVILGQAKDSVKRLQQAIEYLEVSNDRI